MAKPDGGFEDLPLQLGRKSWWSICNHLKGGHLD
jgi:hypothetical protein